MITGLTIDTGPRRSAVKYARYANAAKIPSGNPASIPSTGVGPSSDGNASAMTSSTATLTSCVPTSTRSEPTNRVATAADTSTTPHAPDAKRPKPGPGGTRGDSA